MMRTTAGAAWETATRPSIASQSIVKVSIKIRLPKDLLSLRITVQATRRHGPNGAPTLAKCLALLF